MTCIGRYWVSVFRNATDYRQSGTNDVSIALALVGHGADARRRVNLSPMSYLTTCGYLLGITGLGSIVAGIYAAENGGILIWYGGATVVFGVIMWVTGRIYRKQ